MIESLEQWIDRQHAVAVRGMLASISAVHVIKQRPGFGQCIRPHRGAIVASPVPAAYDPDPDYFFHWFRDAAIVIDALRLLLNDCLLRPITLASFADFVQFSLALEQLDGRTLLADRRWRAAVAPGFERFVRDDAELASAHGEAIGGETRVNPDGTLDISRWGRPQHDGPALRALALLRWAASSAVDAHTKQAMARLLRADLSYVLVHGGEPCVDIWEEEHALHYYTVSVSARALEQGARWLLSEADEPRARACAAEAHRLCTLADGYWSETDGYYRSRQLSSGARSSKELDIAVILAAVHTGSSAARHSVRDPRMHATLTRLENLFDDDYAINHGRAPTHGPAMGRYHGDLYYSGGAYYFATLGAAEFCFRAAAADMQAPHARDLFERGDAYLRTVQRFVPEDGHMSEQFDQRTGLPSSAKELCWSYAAFLSCIAARRLTELLQR